MAESLFTSQTPASQTSEANPGPTLGVVIVVAVAGQVTHLKWYAPSTLPSNAATLPLVLYNATTQAELGRVVPGSLTAGAWNTAALTTPVSVTAGTRLVAAVRTADRYAFTGGLFASAGITNGNLSAPATGSDPVGNGRFASNADAYPGSTFGGHGYFTDVVFVASGGATTHSGSASGASVSAGSAAVTLTARAIASGASVSSGSAAVTLRLAATASATSASTGTAAATVVPAGPVTHQAAASSSSASGGSAALALRMTVAASGASVSTGSAIPGWLLAAAASGVSASSGSAAAAVFGQVVTRPNTGTTTRPASGVTARPSTGITTRATGTTVRPYAGTVTRP